MVALLLVSGITLFGISVNDEAYADWYDDASGVTPDDDGVCTESGCSSKVSLMIGGDNQSQATETGVNTVAYRKQTVTVKLARVADYYLKFYGNSALTPPAGGEVMTGVGVTGVAGQDIKPGTWGYAWDDTGEVADSEMIYRTVPSSSTNLVKPELVDSAVDFTGKLNFAANFPSNATLGNYTSMATLTLIATPKANTGVVNLWRNATGEPTAVDAGTDEMQGVDSTFCSDEVGEGWTIDLKDNRDKKTYTIYKAADGNCWMGQNLALNATDSNGLLLTSEDTDLPNGEIWNLPESGSGGMSSSTKAVQIRIGNTGLSGWKNGYGNYYSWNAATAGTGESAVRREASSSICPKGWKLPSSSDFTGFLNVKSGWITNAVYNDNTGVSGYYLGSTLTTVYKNVNFWPASGYIVSSNGTLGNANSTGYYWSRTPSSGSSDARYLMASSSGIGVSDFNRSTGFSVRCVHDQTGAWNTEGGEGKELQTDLKFMQDITKENFTTKYCANNAATNAIVPVGSTIDLTDNRDNKVYRVVKLADGNCWMQQNLALGPNTLLTSADSDVSSNYTTPADTSSFNTSSDPSPNGQMRIGSTSLNSSWKPEWGNYYSWNAATAGTGGSITSGQAAGSICPKGWKLPTGNTNGQFQALFGANGANLGSDYATKFAVVQDAPYKFPAAGDYVVSLNGSGRWGLCWSRTPNSNTSHAYALFFDSGDFKPANLRSRYVGYSVRCIAEPSE